MKTATKAVRQKKVVQVAVSREVTCKGSTMTQMTVGRMARERRWTKNMRLQRASERTCACWLRSLQRIVQQRNLERITATLGTCSFMLNGLFGCCDIFFSSWHSVTYFAIVKSSKQKKTTNASFKMLNWLDDMLTKKNQISNPRIQPLHTVATREAA